ncbi:Endocytosis regulator [Conoideocrella luteorostrata]|uniref:Endocytosis regulator n=1 Tax=Conoideocrella luteorostrata TaxID=1105319 RepID=A0AAJ0CDG5_9HYPO|nr:Endocytosis regulator [Conoideocrella luteorostrata]
MPHLVTNFLRSSSGNISQIKKTAISRSSKNSSRATSRNNSVSASPYASDSEDHANHSVKMPELGDALKKHRLSLHFGRSKHDGHGSSSQTSANAAASVDWSIESPPIVFYGTPEESTGALISGLMYMDVTEESIDVDSFTASLSMRVTQKRPFQNHCSDCQTKVTELKSWQFLAHPASLRRGKHQFPFSTLLAGDLPASANTPIVSISYHFKAEAVAVRCPNSSSFLPIKFERILDVKRSLPEPLYPHHSVRVFPPTNIKASAHYTSVIHPTGNNQFTLKLDGLMTHNEKVKTVDLWKLKKVTWKLEETIKTTSPACDKHAPSSSTTADEEPKKGITRTETRLLGEKQMHDGWKSDYTGNDGIVDLEFDYTVNPLKANAKDRKYACDLKTNTEDATEISHALLIELIVSKEFAPEGKTHLAAQTGTGRILRMHFAVNLTEYPGLGVSWDNEAPPVYQDVPPSPPGYPCEPPIEYDDLEELDALRQGSGSEPGSRRPSASGRSV